MYKDQSSETMLGMAEEKFVLWIRVDYIAVETSMFVA